MTGEYYKIKYYENKDYCIAHVNIIFMKISNYMDFVEFIVVCQHKGINVLNYLNLLIIKN